MAGESLSVLRGPATGSEIALSDQLLIGRSASGDGNLGNDPELSRRHARIYREQGAFVLEDLGSTNGTYLNEWKIPSSQVLSAGDRINVGGTVLEVNLPADDRTVVRSTPAELSAAASQAAPRRMAPTAPSPPPGPILRAEGVRKAYGSLSVLQGVDLEIHPGEICGLLGPNGAGKTTFVSIVAGLRGLDAGTVEIAGVDAVRNSREARRFLGIAPQDLGIYATVTVRRNLEFFGEIAGLRGAELKAAVEQIGEALSLVSKFDALAGTLSGGQKRRLHTGMALMHRPPLCILDEPTVGADIRTRQEILDVVKRLAEEGRAVCYSTHYLPEIEELGATVAMLEGGEIIARGAIADLVAEHAAQGFELHFDGDAPDVDLGVSGHVSHEGSVIRIESRQPTIDAATALSRLGGAAMRLKEIEILRASLDSVYLALTERRYSGVRAVSHDIAVAALAPPNPEKLVAPAVETA